SFLFPSSLSAVTVVRPGLNPLMAFFSINPHWGVFPALSYFCGFSSIQQHLQCKLPPHKQPYLTLCFSPYHSHSHSLSPSHAPLPFPLPRSPLTLVTQT